MEIDDINGKGPYDDPVDDPVFVEQIFNLSKMLSAITERRKEEVRKLLENREGYFIAYFGLLIEDPEKSIVPEGVKAREEHWLKAIYQAGTEYLTNPDIADREKAESLVESIRQMMDEKHIKYEVE